MFSNLMFCTVSYILGVISAPYISIACAVRTLLVLIVCLTVVLFIKKNTHTIKTLLILSAMFLLGFFAYNLTFSSPVCRKFENQNITLRGTVISTVSSGVENTSKYIVKTDYIQSKSQTYKVKSRILVTSKEAPHFGDVIEVNGVLKDFLSLYNEYGFDTQKYYRSKGLAARVSAEGIRVKSAASSLSPIFLANKVKDRLRNNILSNMEGDNCATALLVILGDKSRLSDSYRQTLRDTGILNILYSSYLHILLLLTLVGVIFQRKRHKDFLLIALVTLFLIWESSSPTALKAGLVLGLFVLRKQILGYADKAYTIFLVLFIMTIQNPMLCFNESFMLSVILSLLVCRSYKSIFACLHKPKNLISRYFAPILTIWLVMVFGALPFWAYYYNSLNPYGVFCTLIMSPFMFVVIILAPILFLIPKAYSVLGIVRDMFLVNIKIIRSFPYFTEKLPFYKIPLPTPSILAVVLYCLLWWLFIKALNGKFKTAEADKIKYCAAALSVCLCFRLEFNTLNIRFINVGQGDAAVLKTSMLDTVLIDGGGSSDSSDYDLGCNITVPYLISHNCRHINTAILTHYHKDHAQGIITAAENLKIDLLVLPDSCPNNEYRLLLEDIAKRKGIKVKYLACGDKIKFRSGLTLTFLAPDYEHSLSENENNKSSVILATYGKFSGLFMGDYEDEEALKYYSEVDLLKVSHHGSTDGNSPAFLNNVAPKYAVISVGESNLYDLPDKSVVDTLAALNARILRTDELGDISFKIKKNGSIKTNIHSGGGFFGRKK